MTHTLVFVHMKQETLILRGFMGRLGVRKEAEDEMKEAGHHMKKTLDYHIKISMLHFHWFQKTN